MHNKCIWFFGLSGAGKTTLANALSKKLAIDRIKILDGDILRKGINSNLGFLDEDRIENVRRTAEIAKLFMEEGYCVIVALITPFESMRTNNRSILGENYIEIFVDTPFEICCGRDPKGLYAQAAKNLLKNFTGKDSIFERPLTPDLIIETHLLSIEESIIKILNSLNFD